MGFQVDTSGAGQEGGGNVDFDAMNNYVVETVGTQKKARTLVGFISGYYDLGMQPRPNFEKIHDPSKKEELEAIEKGEAFLETKDFYDNGKMNKNVEVFSKPRTPAKAFTFAVDFPQIPVDKGQFFGESNEAPLRLIMGGTWAVKNPDKADKKMPTVASPMFMTENTNNDQGMWAFSKNSNLHKMGEAADLLDDHGLFHKEDITSLLGKAMMFKIRVYMKPAKKGDKEYYTEEIKFVSEVAEGLNVPDFDESYIHGVNMGLENDPDHVKQLRAVIKNTMRLSVDWDDSVIKQEIEDVAKQRKAEAAAKKADQEEEEGNDEEGNGGTDPFDDDIPFD